MIVQTFSKFRNNSKTKPALFFCLSSVVTVVLLFSCRSQDAAPDVSNIQTNVTIQRFDKDFFSMDTLHLQSSLQALERKYPAFLSLYFKFFAPVREIAERNNLSFDEALKEYLRLIRPLYND
ncbi:MAG TPA: hypothetical protein VFL47_03350, partial [Flavisolibacter sp.]|nr:hypothetical protein [Flavisolibacter sp.]